MHADAGPSAGQDGLYQVLRVTVLEAAIVKITSDPRIVLFL